MTVGATLAFSREEYGRRLEAVRRALREREADLLLVDAKEHLGYLTGFAPSGSMYQVCVVPLEADPVMVFRLLDEPTFRERTWLTDYVCFGDAADPVATLADTLHARGWANRRIAVELDSNYLPVSRYEAIRAALPGATFVDFSLVLRELRLRKSPEEIACLRRAAAIADEAMRRAVEAVGEGKSERAAALAAAAAFLELGAESTHLGPITSGSRTDSLHGALGDHRLERGEIIHMELVPQVNGYSARLMRPTVIGEPSGRQREVAQTLVALQDEQIAAVRPGAIARDVDRLMREGALKAGLRDRYENTTGYTVGFYGSPYPPRSSDFTRVLLPTSDWTFEPGMTFHMYTNAGGMAFSETVLVTETGQERLTRLDRRLFVR